MKNRSKAHELIARNIRDHGYHVYVVYGGPTPRWIYTIGLSKKLGYEIIFAGGATYPKDDVLQIIRCEASSAGASGLQLGQVCRQWAMQLLGGAHDFCQSDVVALQLLPQQIRRTIDVPDLSTPLAFDQATPWRWLQEPWPYRISEKSEAMTDHSVLMGARATEVARWEEQYWEVFSGSGEEVSNEDAFLVPLGTLLGADPSLSPIAELDIGRATWRDQNGDWQAWA